MIRIALSFARLGLACAAAFAATLILAVPAEAQQQQNANLYAYWNYNGANGFWNTDQIMWVGQKAASTYWAQYWQWTDDPSDQGGYIGLQTNGAAGGDTAIFSLWNANAASGTSCGQFGGEGNGYSCRLPFSIKTNTNYRYRVWRLNADAGGQWWGGWIYDPSSGEDVSLGSIRVAASHTLMGQPMNFTEYFGAPVASCNNVPVSQVNWTQPASNLNGSAYQYSSSYAGWQEGSCTGGIAMAENYGWTQGVEVSMGGSQCGVLAPGQLLTPGQTRKSCDGRFTLSMQSDSNLVLYENGVALWATSTVGKNVVQAIMQTDGNLVLYSASDSPIWSSNTWGHSGAYLAIQNDGNLVVYSTASSPLWASNTCCH